MRLELQARTELTLKVLLALAGRRRLQASTIAAQVDSSATYVAQLVAPLTRAGWVRSSPGPTGGYELVTALADHSLLELIELVEGPTDDRRCVMADHLCLVPERCALHDAWTRARTALVAELDAAPLDTLVRTQETGVSP